MRAFYPRCTAQKARASGKLVPAQIHQVLPFRMLGYAQYALPNI
jgi:hypothetical protein